MMVTWPLDPAPSPIRLRRLRVVESRSTYCTSRKVIAAAEGADLPSPALYRLGADGVGIGAAQTAAFFAMPRVVVAGGEAFVDGPLGPLCEQLAHPPCRRACGSLCWRPRRWVPHRKAQRRSSTYALFTSPVLRTGGDHANAAVDVVADAARRDRAVLGIDRSDTADGKAITPMDIGHREAVTDDAGKNGRRWRPARALCPCAPARSETVRDTRDPELSCRLRAGSPTRSRRPV